jgi:YggT family protein
LLGFLLSAIIWFLKLLELLIFVDAILSWFIRPRSNQISKYIGIVVDPVLTPCSRLQRKLFPKAPVDFSPLIAILIIEFFRMLILNLFV